jgi:hypothetical protein
MSELAFRRMPRTIDVIAASTVLSAFALLASTGPTSSAPLHPTAVHEQMKDISGLVEVGALGRRSCAAVGACGAWVGPGWYWWPPGGAVLVGAAIRFVEARNAPAYAGPQPAPATCWYYTEPSRIQGFWDYCPL